MKKSFGWLAAGTSVAMLLAVAGRQSFGQMAAPASELTVTEPMDVGGKVLEAGTYRIEVVRLDESRNLLQVKSPDGMQLYTTVLSVPHDTVAGEVVPENRFVYFPARPGIPMVLRTWYEKDRSSGHDIVYPRARALELAA